MQYLKLRGNALETFLNTALFFKKDFLVKIESLVKLSIGVECTFNFRSRFWYTHEKSKDK